LNSSDFPGFWDSHVVHGESPHLEGLEMGRIVCSKEEILGMLAALVGIMYYKIGKDHDYAYLVPTLVFPCLSSRMFTCHRKYSTLVLLSISTLYSVLYSSV